MSSAPLSSLPVDPSVPPVATATPAVPGPAATTADTTPTAQARPGFLVVLGLAAIGAAMAQLVPAILTTALKARQIDAAHATSILSLAVGVAAAVSLVAYPAFGRLSDRTTSRLGRRRPYLLLGALLFAAGAVLALAASSVLVLVVAAIATMVGFSATTVAITALIPDQLPADRRGPASAVVGLSLPVGAVVGLFIAQAVSSSLAAMILLPAAVAVVGVVVLAATVRERVLTREERPALHAAEVFSTFWVNPAKHPDFAWAWFSRLLIFFGVAAVQAYQVFYLGAVLHLPGARIATSIFQSTLVLTVSALVLAAVAGRVSDRVGRRKPFVVGAALLFAVGLVVVSMASTFSAFLVGIAVVGAGQGLYFAVDLNLVTQILPNPEDTAKDLGVMNLANTLPSSLVPALAPAILLIGASAARPQNYPALFLAGAIAGLVGAVLVLPIRRAR